MSNRSLKREVKMLRRVLAPKHKEDIASVDGNNIYGWTYRDPNTNERTRYISKSEKKMRRFAAKRGYTLIIVSFGWTDNTASDPMFTPKTPIRID